jgi:hypothetical protein
MKDWQVMMSRLSGEEEQEVFRQAGATERDIQAHGRLMMQVVERMEGYTDPIEVIGLG